MGVRMTPIGDATVPWLPGRTVKDAKTGGKQYSEIAAYLREKGARA
jgi:hypothetical protein